MGETRDNLMEGADSLTDSTPLFQMVSLVSRLYLELTCQTNRVGVPHKTLKEDVYRDMYIPKGKLYQGFGRTRATVNS